MKIEEILRNQEHLIISVIGPHAGESLNAIFSRKISDIKKCGFTYWICKSRAISPTRINALHEANNSDIFILFVKTAGNREGKKKLYTYFFIDI